MKLNGRFPEILNFVKELNSSLYIYLQFLYKEILSIKHKSPLSTIYVGGGTPSILDPAQIKELIDLFKENSSYN